MKRLTQLTLVGVLLLGMVSLAVAQDEGGARAGAATLQPVVRLGNFIEVGNDVFMHIIATADMRYMTVQNLDFDERIRDQTLSRSPTNTAQHETEGDLFYAELRFGVDFRYQKNLTFQLMFENQSVFDGNLIDDRSNTSNPGGTDVFGRAASTENPGFRVERFWARYRFEGTPVTLFVGAELKKVSQAGIFGNDDPGVGVEVNLGNLELSAKAYIERESFRLGLQNDNDLVSYVFTAQYNLRPHRFGVDVAWFRDRFNGADTAVVGCDRPDIGCSGQKVDSVWIDASWTGRFGPIRALLQGNVILGKADGGTGGLPAGVQAGQEYDIFAGAGIAYAEVDLGVVRPFVLGVYGTGDGDPRDRQLRGFQVQAVADSTQWATDMMGHFDRSSAAGGRRDYSCPARLRGVRRAAPANNPYAIGTEITDSAPGRTQDAGAECYHSVSNLFNSRLGNSSHGAIVTTYSNPGTIVASAGLRTFPLKGHEITGWYVYRAMADNNLLEEAFAPEIQAGVIRKIRRTLYHELGAFWMWTLNPHFDIRAAGNIAYAGDGSRDLAHLADCDPGPASRTCQGETLALRGDVRFRARF
jgi:hypothetical protein